MTDPLIEEYTRLAFLEGEGLGTAYEYYAKYSVLKSQLLKKKPSKILIAGLPEKYGYSLDFSRYAFSSGAELTVIDERRDRILTHKKLINKILPSNSQFNVNYLPIESWNHLPKLDSYDIALSCEVLQRLHDEDKKKYANFLGNTANAVAIFTPNAENKSHVTISGLNTLNINELVDIFSRYFIITSYGFLDMPPFPPGKLFSNITMNERVGGKISNKIRFLGHSLELWYNLIEHGMFKMIPIRSFYHIVYLVGLMNK